MATTAATPGNASLPGVQFPNTCPTCRGTARNPEAPTEIADDDGTCRVCCDPIHPWHAARHGQVRFPAVVLADPIIQARLAALAEFT
jgi:hypothetical protein